jgi:mannonate dehydratase
MAIRISLGHIDQYDDRVGAFAVQLGLKSVQLHDPSNLTAVDGYWRETELRELRDRCAAAD